MCGPSCKSWTTKQCLGNRRPGDGLGTAVTLGHRRVQPNAGAPRARPARAVRFASKHGGGAVWPAQGGPTRGELQRARPRRGQVRRRSGSGFREAGPCRWVRRRRRRICATCSPGPVSTHRPRVRPAGSHNGSGCRGRPSGLGMHNNSARRCADRAVNRGRRSNVWGTGGRATASGQQSLSATAGFSQTRAPREQGPHELSGLQECSVEGVQCGLRREGRRGASCNGRGDAGARCGAGAG